MWGAFDKTAAILLAVYGIISIPLQIYDQYKSAGMAIVSGILVLIVFGASALRYFFPALTHWRAGYGRLTTKSIIAKRKSIITVDNNYVATIDKWSDLVFFAAPPARDLVDMIDSLPGKVPEERDYVSTDAVVGDIRRSAGGTKVLWQPKTNPIKSLQVYRHHSRHVSPSLYGDDAFYHSIFFDRDVGVADLTIHLAHPAGDAIAYVLPWWESQITEARLFDHAIRRPIRGCEQPIIAKGGKEITWHLERPIRGRVYVVFVIYEGWRDRYVKEAQQKESIRRIVGAR